MTPQAALIELLGRVGAEQGAAALVKEHELSHWPGAAVAAMKSQKLLAKARPATSAICPGCEQDCVMPVHTLPHPTRPSSFIVCDKRSDINRVRVPIDRLIQWQSSGELIAAVLAKLLGINQPSTHLAASGQWPIGSIKGKKHRSQVTLLAGDNLTLSLAGHSVQLMDVLMFKQDVLTLDEGELVRLVDQPAGDSEGSRAPGMKGNASGSGQDTSAIQCEVFLAMKNLTANEVSLTFVGDKSESGIGANNMLEISARGKRKLVALAALNLVDKRKGAPNSQCVILLGMVQKLKLPNNNNNSKKIERLRKVFSSFLGIKSDPFNPYRKGAGWEPLFSIEDKRGAADERAKQEGERRTSSTDHPYHNENSEKKYSYHNRKDEANDNWLENNDPDAPT